MSTTAHGQVFLTSQRLHLHRQHRSVVSKSMWAIDTELGSTNNILNDVYCKAQSFECSPTNPVMLLSRCIGHVLPFRFREIYEHFSAKHEAAPSRVAKFDGSISFVEAHSVYPYNNAYFVNIVS